MASTPLLKAAARAGRPVLLKRGFGATVDEWLLAAEYLLDGGCPGVILCERGIRSFEPGTRATLDVGGLALAKLRTRLPVLADPSHAAGTRALVQPLALAALAAGADGLIVECHPDPARARSDGPQALLLEELHPLVAASAHVARAVGRTVEVCSPHPWPRTIQSKPLSSASPR
jgi:3-deoxy-7-phosphoheptulonate synthase